MQNTVMEVAGWLVSGYMLCIVLYVLSSWVPAIRQNVIGRVLAKLVEPYLNLFRFIPPIGMIDISPIIAIFLFNFLSGFLLLGIQEVLQLVG